MVREGGMSKQGQFQSGSQVSSNSKTQSTNFFFFGRGHGPIAHVFIKQLIDTHKIPPLWLLGSLLFFLKFKTIDFCGGKERVENERDG